MTNHEFRYAANPVDARKYGTEELPKEFLIKDLFVKDQIQLTYSMFKHYIVVKCILSITFILKLFNPCNN